MDVRYAVFVEPEGDLKRVVQEWKARVAQRFPGAMYLRHPPHGTVWVGHLKEPEAAFEAVRKAAATVTAVPRFSCHPHVFYEDGGAGGAQTCAFASALSGELRELQAVVSEALVGYLAPGAPDGLPMPLHRDPFLRSWLRYGFPFVGPHWIPHFTIAALPVHRADDAVREFLESHERPAAVVDELSWWRVAHDHHDRIDRLGLGQRDV